MHCETADCVLSLVARRGPDETICPSEVARAIHPVDWRDHLEDVRQATAKLAACGKVVVLQRGQVVDPVAAKGPIRIGLPRR